MDLSKLEKKIGIAFKNKDLLKEALTHRSYVNENTNWDVNHNERLEFLGDAVLELIVTEDIFKKFPNKEEGELTLYRSALVNSKMLGAIAYEIGLGDSIFMSKGEAQESVKNRSKDKLAANAIEAVIGAIYLDKGYDMAEKFVLKFVMPHLKEVEKGGGKDAKSKVQEIAQSDMKITPIYKVLEEFGPAHKRVFTVGLYFGDELKSKGKGVSKQEAELEAAREWLAAQTK